MKRAQFERWVRQISETRDEEISCTECFDLISRYVDLEIAGEAAESKLPHLRHHLDQCRVCREEYEILRDLARLEAGGDIPSPQDSRQTA